MHAAKWSEYDGSRHMTSTDLRTGVGLLSGQSISLSNDRSHELQNLQRWWVHNVFVLITFKQRCDMWVVGRGGLLRGESVCTYNGNNLYTCIAHKELCLDPTCKNWENAS